MHEETKLIQLTSGKQMVFKKNERNERYYTSDYSLEVVNSFGTKKRDILVETIYDLYCKVEELERKLNQRL